REGVLGQGERVAEALGGLRELGGARLPGAEDADAAVDGLAREYDDAHGGFGGAPKFPPSMLLSFLLAQYRRTGSSTALEMARGLAPQTPTPRWTAWPGTKTSRTAASAGRPNSRRPRWSPSR